MSEGFVGRMRVVGAGHTVWGDDSDGHMKRVWVQPLVPGEPKPGEVWETPGGRRATITHAPYSILGGTRYVPTDKGLFSIDDLRPLPVYPWHRRADGSAEGRDKDQRVLRNRRSYWSASHFFVARGKCERKGDRRQNDENL